MKQSMIEKDLGYLKTKRHKFEKGKKFENIGEVVNWLNTNNSIYVRNKFTHFGWALGFQLRYLINEVNRGVVYQALKIEKAKE